MTRKHAVLAGVAIVIIALAGMGLYWYNKPHAGVGNKAPEVQISVADLYNEYQRDELNADKKFLNRIIEVTGEVTDVQTTSGSTIITLSLAGELGGVSCRLATNENPNIDSHKTKIMTIKGKCSGFLMDVNLVDCVIIK